MKLFTLEGGRVIRRADGQPLKTKLVATIGNEKSYDQGLYDLNNNQLSPINYDRLVAEFYANGVDVIRLNLSHVKIGEVGTVFNKIKRAVLRCETGRGARKRMAVLADLPGPKIRFRLAEPVTFRVGEPFTVHFDEAELSDSGATVYVDDAPLLNALAGGGAGPRAMTRRRAIRYGSDARVVENLLGWNPAGEGKARDGYRQMMDEVKARLGEAEGVLVVVGDGEVIMRVEPRSFSAEGNSLTCRVVTVKGAQAGPADTGAAAGITLKGNKGFTLKGVDFNIRSFTREDAAKLDGLLEADYGSGKRRESVLAFIALSFAQTAADVLRMKAHIDNKLKRLGASAEGTRLRAPSVIAKIETKKGWENRDFILDVADGIMVARGDLGLQTEIEEVPAIQKRLIKLCNKRGKPVITATEMLKSMTESIEPTRAEGTDVFNAILDGSDAVMMSEETSRGKYPIHSIRKMISIAVQAELYFESFNTQPELRRSASLLRYQEFLKDDYDRVKDNNARFEEVGRFLDEMAVKGGWHREWGLRTLKWAKELYKEKWGKSIRQTTTNRITQATCTMSEAEDVKAIIAASTTGRTVRMISRLRPTAIVVGATHDVINTRKLSLSYGVLPLCIGEVTASEGTEGIFLKCHREIAREPFLGNLFEDGDSVIFTAGTRLGRPGTTDLIHMRRM